MAMGMPVGVLNGVGAVGVVLWLVHNHSLPGHNVQLSA